MYEWFQMILFISVSTLHQFLNNLFCELLIQQQLSVAEAAYDTPWLTASRTFQTAVHMMIRQSRHFTRLSGWKMYQMGLGTFVEFVKLLGSYFLVLQSLHADETTSAK
ncbi:hypothetical protein J6590_017159 [Homalodisca vitripennis]|nr:hypothetical protein J6590_017159 [Homalodisca vitripennis]